MQRMTITAMPAVSLARALFVLSAQAPRGALSPAAEGAMGPRRGSSDSGGPGVPRPLRPRIPLVFSSRRRRSTRRPTLDEPAQRPEEAQQRQKTRR